MLKCSSLVQPPHQALLLSSSSCLAPVRTAGTLSLGPVQARRASRSRLGRGRVIRCDADSQQQAQAPQQAGLTATKSPATVKAVVTVKVTMGGMFAHVGITRGLDDIGDLLGRTMLLELVSAELDPNTGKQKKTVEAFAHRESQTGGEAKYEANFSVPEGFGEIGGVLVTNEHHKEMYLNDIVLMTGDETAALNIDCRSWVHSKFDNPEKRIFFTTKSYLPSETPAGLLELRKKELDNLRGNGTGERKTFERIYDYDTYNDLGDPDSKDMARPVLGGTKELPYPRRCRTGRPKTKKDPLSEKRSGSVYIPRDESFSEVKGVTFSAKTLRSVLHVLVPSIEGAMADTKVGFPHFKSIDSLFNEGLSLPKQEGISVFRTIIPRLFKALEAGTESALLFETPPMIDKDKFSWFRDEEFSRQTLAGLNPFSIQLVTEFPFVSKLDPEIYGPPESAITEEIINQEIRGVMTVKEALEQKKLFVLKLAQFPTQLNAEIFLHYIQFCMVFSSMVQSLFDLDLNREVVELHAKFTPGFESPKTKQY